MKRKIIVLLAVTMILMVAVTVAYAHGHEADQLRGKWTCINTGPHNWTHCFSPKVTFPDDVLQGNFETVQVKVFGEDGYPFLGTEILVHEDIYNDQPCMTDGGGLYHDLDPMPYFACHHFSTH